MTFSQSLFDSLKKQYYRVPGGAGWYYSYHEVGDTVLRLTKESSRYSVIKKGAITLVDEVIDSSATNTYITDEYGNYVPLYEQRIKVKGSTQVYNGSGFGPVRKKETMLAIENDRPTFVREFIDSTFDGKAVRTYVGDLLPFNNLSAAQNYCAEEISKSIRATNTYRKFSIVVEKAVAQAKKPEVEFA